MMRIGRIWCSLFYTLTCSSVKRVLLCTLCFCHATPYLCFLLNFVDFIVSSGTFSCLYSSQICIMFCLKWEFVLFVILSNLHSLSSKMGFFHSRKSGRSPYHRTPHCDSHTFSLISSTLSTWWMLL